MIEEKVIERISNWIGEGSINIFGRPFAGKDTQGEILANELDGVLVGGGDILRHHPDQERIRALLATGELIPSDVFFEIVLPFLSQDKLRGHPLILNSIGRLNGEQETIFETTNDSGHPTMGVIMLRLSDDQVIERYHQSKLTRDRGDRSDDNLESLKVRLHEFSVKTEPVIDFYRAKGLLWEIDGSQSREEVTQAIFQTLDTAAQKAK